MPSWVTCTGKPARPVARGRAVGYAGKKTSRRRVARLCDSRKCILVTGGAELLGSHLCDRLIEQGHELLCADNLLTGTKHDIDHLHGQRRFELIRHDVTFPLFVELEEIGNFARAVGPRSHGGPA